MKKLISNKGFTLLEVVMMIVILSIVGITFGGTVLNLVRMSTSSFVTKKAAILASNEFEKAFAYKANNPPDLWQSYLNTNFNSSQTIDDFTVTSSTLSSTTDPITGRLVLYNLQVTVSHPSLTNTLQFNTGFSPRQWN